MGRVRFTLQIVTLVTNGFAVGCGGASEAGPRLKRTQPLRETKVLPEAASNSPIRSPKKNALLVEAAPPVEVPYR